MAKSICFRPTNRVLKRCMATQAACAGRQEGTQVLLVVAVCLINEDGKVLLAERPKSKHMGGRYEFPGGKVEAGERPEAALARELKEELGISCGSLEPLTFCSHAYETFHLLMPLYQCRSWNGKLEGKEGQRLVWADAEELESYEMPPADLPLLPFVKRAMRGDL